MGQLNSRIVSAAIAAALILSSTASGATSTPGPAAAQPQLPQTSWLTLSMLDASGSMALAGAAAQPGNPPPPPAYDNSEAKHVPWIAIGVWLAFAVLVIHAATKDHGHHNQPPPVVPVSPA